MSDKKFLDTRTYPRPHPDLVRHREGSTVKKTISIPASLTDVRNQMKARPVDKPVGEEEKKQAPPKETGGQLRRHSRSRV